MIKKLLGRLNLEHGKRKVSTIFLLIQLFIVVIVKDHFGFLLMNKFSIKVVTLELLVVVRNVVAKDAIVVFDFETMQDFYDNGKLKDHLDSKQYI